MLFLLNPIFTTIHIKIRSTYQILSLSITLPKLDCFVHFKCCRSDDILCGMTSGTQNCIRVAWQSLDNLLRLEVPYVHQVVFWAWHYPLWRDVNLVVLEINILCVRHHECSMNYYWSKVNTYNRGVFDYF